MESLPKLIAIWPTFGRPNGMTRAQAYSAVYRMPDSIKVKIGGRLWLNSERLAVYLNRGGDLAY